MTMLKEIGRDELKKLKTVRHETFQAKYEAEEIYQSTRLGFHVARVKSWIPEPMQSDLKQILKGSVPIHVEVIARITVSSFVAYVLALGNFPNVIPESQRVLIAMLGSTLSMLFPTLIFTIGLVMFPSMIFVTLLGLVLATMLLACSAGVGLGFYVAMFGFTALVISGMRFSKKTGAMTCFLVIEIALNSQPLARVANDLGMEFVRSLWTERGVTNEKALYTNTLVGMMWIIFCMIVGRLLPPFRTARTGIVKGLLPVALNHVADSIDLNAEDLKRQAHTKPSDKESIDNTGESSISGDGSASPSLEERRREVVAKLIHEKSVLTHGSIAALTAFEPRIFRCGPPVCSWKVLQSLCLAVDRTVLASLALGQAWIDPKEMTVKLEQELIPSHVKAAASLRTCARAIMTNSKVEEDDTERQEVAQGKKDDDGIKELMDTLAIDPIFFKAVSHEVVTATNNWADAMGPTDRTKPYLDKNARAAVKLNLLPWFKGAFGYFIGLFKNCQTALSWDTWKQVFRPPYTYADKASWCLDFTVGFTSLVAMGVYWQEFVNLDNESWFLIAYAFSTTQTAEGTVKKGFLRLLGTAAGGLSGWLAITACGEDGMFGLIAWLTVFTAIAAYIGLPRGFKARLGLSPDYGYGPAYFVMTQALVVAQVNLGLGDKRTVTVNRISTNAVGIAMAIILALLPPALYGGNPKFARNILNEEKALLVQCLHLLVSYAEGGSKSSRVAGEQLEAIRKRKASTISPLIEEANDFYSDSSKLHSFHLLKVDPKLKICLDTLQVTASWIFVSIGYAFRTLQDDKLGDDFLSDSKSQTELKKMLKTLETGLGEESFERLTIQDEENVASAATRSVVFVDGLMLSIRELQKVENELKTIKYGLCS